jgi:hypothetical protein
MIDERKTRMMTKLAIYEKTEGREDIRLSKYYKSDYVRLNILKTILQVTLGSVLILVLVILYKSEYLIEKAVTLDYAYIGRMIFAIYGTVLVVYVVAVTIGYSIYYEMSRKRLAKYFKFLKIMQKFYKEQDESKFKSAEDGQDTDIDDADEEIYDDVQEDGRIDIGSTDDTVTNENIQKGKMV